MIGLIDADSFVYRCGFAVEKTLYLVECEDGRHWHPAGLKEMHENEEVGDVVWTRREVGTLEECLSLTDSKIRTAIQDANVTDPFLYLSPVSGNFRDNIATIRKYKGNRDGHVKPVYYSELRDHLVSAWGARIVVGREADDQVSFLARYHQSQGREVVVVGQDKDLYQIPGNHFNWVTGDDVQLTEYDARAWFWTQTLSGDSGDNILGCYRVGPAKARALVQAERDMSDNHMWPIVVAQYAKAIKLPSCPYADKQPELVALEMARLVRLNTLAHEGLWNPDCKEVIAVEEKGSSEEATVQGKPCGAPVEVRGSDLQGSDQPWSGI